MKLEVSTNHTKDVTIWIVYEVGEWPWSTMLRPLDHGIAECLIWVAIVSHVDCFKCQVRRWDALQVIRCQSKFFFPRLNICIDCMNLEWCPFCWIHNAISSSQVLFWCTSLATSPAIYHSIIDACTKQMLTTLIRLLFSFAHMYFKWYVVFTVPRTGAKRHVLKRD